MPKVLLGQMVASRLLETWQGTRHFRPLDGLRAVAVTMVFCCHYGVVGAVSPIFWWGWTGVDLFFVLSGMLITGILFDAPRGPGYFSTFYKRRSLRIFPLYFAYWALILLIRLVTEIKWPVADLAWVVYLGNFLPLLAIHRGINPDYYTNLWLSNHSSAGYHATIVIGHFWSLCVEEQFYLIWPAVVWFCSSRRTLMRLCVTGIVGTLLLRIVLEITLPNFARQTDLLYKLSFTRADSLLMGAWLALYVRRGNGIPARHAAYIYCAGLGALVVFMVSAAYFHTGSLAKLTQIWLTTYGFSLLGVMSVAALVAVIRVRFLQRLLTWPPILDLGKVSYGFYVLHLLLIGLFPNLILRSRFPVLLGIGFFAVIWALSWLSFRFLETPFLRLKDRWAPARESPVVISSARVERETYTPTAKAA